MRSNQNHFNRPGETRRQFIKQTSLAAAAVAGASLLPLRISAAENKSGHRHRDRPVRCARDSTASAMGGGAIA